jgi:hypothetical protein
MTRQPQEARQGKSKGRLQKIITTRQDKARHDTTGQYRSVQDRVRQDKATNDKIRQEQKTREEGMRTTKQDNTKQD